MIYIYIKMFSIIDNEIIVKFEMLGGSTAPPTGAPTGAPPTGAPTGATTGAPPTTGAPTGPSVTPRVALTSSGKSPSLSVAPSLALTSSGNSPSLSDALLTYVNKVDDQVIVNELDNAGFELPNDLNFFEYSFRDMRKFIVDIDPSVLESGQALDPLLNKIVSLMDTLKQNGGNLNGALSKDVQFDLIGKYIGGASTSLPNMLTKIFKLIVLYFRTRKNNESNDQALKNWKQVGDLIGEDTSIPEIISRNNKNKIEVKNGNQVMSLDQYWKVSLKNPNLNTQDILYCFTMSDVDLFDEKNKLCMKALYKIRNEVNRENVNLIHPKIIFNIIKSLKIGGTESRGSIMKIISYNTWINSLAKDAVEKLNKNSKDFATGETIPKQLLIADLVKLLISYMNANPQIINKNLPDSTKPDSSGVLPPPFNRKLENFDDARNDVNESIDLTRARVFALTGDGRFYVGLTPAKGGGFVFPSTSKNRIENIPIYSKQLRSMFEILKNRLRSYNKTLGKTTEDKIENIFKSLEKHEKEAKELINQLDYYYLDVKVNKNRNAEEVTDTAWENAKKNLDKNLKQIKNRSYQILDIGDVLIHANHDAKIAATDTKFAALPANIE